MQNKKEEIVDLDEAFDMAAKMVGSALGQGLKNAQQIRSRLNDMLNRGDRQSAARRQESRDETRDDVRAEVNGEKPKQTVNQEVDRPSHYMSKSGQDVIDVAEDFGIIDNAYKFNMLKYLLRGGKKAGNSELQDMMKIRVYLDRYIETLRS